MREQAPAGGVFPRSAVRRLDEFSPEGLRHLVAVCGSDHVVYGSDMPYNWPDTADIIAGAIDLSEQQRMAILGGNLTTMLRLPPALSA